MKANMSRPRLLAIFVSALLTFLVLLMHLYNTRQMQRSFVSCAALRLGDMRNISSIVVFGVASVYHQAKELTRTLKQNCTQVVQISRLDDLDVLDDAALYILLTPQLVPVYPKSFIAYQVEQWGTGWISRSWGSLNESQPGNTYAEVFEAAVEVWDYNRWNIKHFKYPQGLRREHVKYVPFAWFPFVPVPATDARDIDVLFFGAMNDKREAKLAYLRDIGVNITIVSAQEMELDAFVLRAKIVLNLHYYDGLLETSRIMHAISLKALVISEPAKDQQSNRDFAKALVFKNDVAAIADSVVYFLDNDGKRQEVIEQAYAYSRQKYPLQPWLSQTCVGSLLSQQGASVP